MEGLTSDKARWMAHMLENQSKRLRTEATINATSTAAGSEEWNGVALPLVRRIFGSGIMTADIMSVQPMNLPSGLVFYIDFQYGDTRGRFTAGKSLYGGSANAKFGTTDAAEGGLYGTGRYTYTFNTTSSAVAASALVSSGSATWADVRFNDVLSASVAAGRVYKLVVPTSSLELADIEAVRSFVISGSQFGPTRYYEDFTRNNGANIEFYVSASTAASASVNAGIVVTYSKQPLDYDRGDFEDRTGADLNIPTIDLQMKSEPIVAKSRKLKAIWTMENQQDLAAYHSVDAEEELTNVMSDYVAMEIDMENLDMLLSRALTVDFWSAKIGVELDNNGTIISDSLTAAASAYTKNAWFQTLGSKINAVSNKIHQLTMRGGANFAICSTRVANIFESIPGFVADTTGDSAKFAGGVTRIGSIASRFTIYKAPYFLENVILVGYRGAAFLETGAVYAPYVPLMTTPIVFDADNFTPRKALATRYAKKMIKPEFYGLVYIRDINFI